MTKVLQNKNNVDIKFGFLQLIVLNILIKNINL
jgi:hypothetical protein